MDAIETYAQEAAKFFAWAPKPAQWEERYKQLQDFLALQGADRKIAWVTVRLSSLSSLVVHFVVWWNASAAWEEHSEIHWQLQRWQQRSCFYWVCRRVTSIELILSGGIQEWLSSLILRYFIEAGYTVILLYRKSSIMPYHRHVTRQFPLDHFTIENDKVTRMRALLDWFGCLLIAVVQYDSKEKDIAEIIKTYRRVQAENRLFMLDFVTVFISFHLDKTRSCSDW